MWNYISIPLSYKYDISYMMEDILLLLYALQYREKGELTIHWLPDTFRCGWIVRWDREKLNIQSQWENTVGHLERLLNEKPNISLKKDDFIKEWKSILCALTMRILAPRIFSMAPIIYHQRAVLD